MKRAEVITIAVCLLFLGGGVFVFKVVAAKGNKEALPQVAAAEPSSVYAEESASGSEEEEDPVVDPVIAEVLHFLNETALGSRGEFEGLTLPDPFGLKAKSDTDYTTEKGSVSVRLGPFAYDAAEKTLSWFTITSDNSSANYGPTYLARRSAVMREYSFALESADPIIAAKPKKYYREELKKSLATLTLKGIVRVRQKSWVKVPDPAPLIEVLESKGIEKLVDEYMAACQPWHQFLEARKKKGEDVVNPLENEVWNERETAELILPDSVKAMRVQNALEDLYEVHGVKPSKY